MNREAFELWVAFYHYRSGGGMPPHQAYVLAREAARQGPPTLDLRHLRGFREYMIAVDAAAPQDTVEIPKTLLRKLGGPVVEAILSRLSSPTRVALAIVAEVLLLVDQQDLLPVRYDDMLEWLIGTGIVMAIALRSQKKPTDADAKP